MKTHIPGGYYMKARCIQESKIAHAPPHVREIWDWLLREANHSDTHVCKRGQCVRTYRDIQDGLCWYVGYRKESYKKHHCEKSMKWLTKEHMIATTKTTRGLLITICNYDTYQTPANYERDNESHNGATRKLQCVATINKNEKEGLRMKEGEREKYGALGNVSLTPLEYNQLQAKYPEDADKLIELLDTKLGMKEYDIKSHYVALTAESEWVWQAYRESATVTDDGGFPDE